MPADKTVWKYRAANSWWCIAYPTGLLLPWTVARTKRAAWESWRKWYGGDAEDEARGRPRYKAVRILVTEVPDAR